MRISDWSSDVCSSDLCVEPDDIDPNSDTIKGSTRWAIATDADTPEEAVLHHLDQNLHAMSQRGKRIPRWLPPETFTGKLHLAVDAVLIPRIAIGRASCRERVCKYV